MAHAEQAKRQLGIPLAAAEPFLSKLIIDKLGVEKLIGKVVGDVSKSFNGKTGSVSSLRVCPYQSCSGCANYKPFRLLIDATIY